MTRLLAPLFLLGASFLLAPRLASATPITIPTVPVGNAGNAPDQLWPFNNPTNLQFGSVAYDYRIGTTEVTNAQYAAFLNAKAASDPLGLYNINMGSNAAVARGITRSGSDGSYTYSTKTNLADKPVNFVSWYDAIRFTNWLHNGQGSGDTETGAYTLLGGTPEPSNGVSITRNVGAKWWLPSEDEWYKAAYHQPADQGGDIDDYWLYPTASNSEPTLATANSIGDISNPGANVANYDGGADWNGSLSGNATTVGGAGPLSESFYGTADQGGNVWEWNEALISSVSGLGRGSRGGSFNEFAVSLRSSLRAGIPPTWEFSNVGFRVATIPEPSTVILLAFAMIGLIAHGYRRRKSS